MVKSFKFSLYFLHHKKSPILCLNEKESEVINEFNKAKLAIRVEAVTKQKVKEKADLHMDIVSE